jgi:copper resistance protein B
MKRAPMTALLLALASGAIAQTDSEREHVPPDPPQSRVHAMPYREMAEMMGMDDSRRFGKIMFDRLEWRATDSSIYEWDAAAWYGGDFNKLWLVTEGEHVAGDTADARLELLWDRIATAWWSTRVGLRQDTGFGPARSWAAFGVAGLAPGFIELTAMAYVGEGGRTALRLSTDWDLLLTQRLVLQRQLELNVYGRQDAARHIGAGLSDLEMGIRLRYELRREAAPYVGVSWLRRFGASADFARAAGEDPDDLVIVAGIRLWF